MEVITMPRACVLPLLLLCAGLAGSPFLAQAGETHLKKAATPAAAQAAPGKGHGATPEEAARQAGNLVGGAVRSVGKTAQTAANATETQAEAAGRSTAQWLKHAGHALAGFFRGLGEGFKKPE
jgi:hypothetical protein